MAATGDGHCTVRKFYDPPPTVSGLLEYGDVPPAVEKLLTEQVASGAAHIEALWLPVAVYAKKPPPKGCDYDTCSIDVVVRDKRERRRLHDLAVEILGVNSVRLGRSEDGKHDLPHVLVLYFPPPKPDLLS